MGGGGGGSSEVVPTADQIAQEQINAKLWNYYVSDYKPVVDKYINRTTDPEIKSEEERKIAGQINAEAVKNIKPDDVSSNPIANEKRLNILTKTETGAQMQGQGAIRSRKLNEYQNVVDIGQGQATTAGAGIGELAGQSLQSEISNLEIQDQAQSAIEDSYGSLAGAVAAGMIKSYDTSKVKGRQLTNK
jgi:hypothetical protein